MEMAGKNEPVGHFTHGRGFPLGLIGFSSPWFDRTGGEVTNNRYTLFKKTLT